MVINANHVSAARGSTQESLTVHLPCPAWMLSPIHNSGMRCHRGTAAHDEKEAVEEAEELTQDWTKEQ